MKEHYVIVCLRGEIFDCVISRIYHSPDGAQKAVANLRQSDKKSGIGEYDYRICKTAYTA